MRAAGRRRALTSRLHQMLCLYFPSSSSQTPSLPGGKSSSNIISLYRFSVQGYGSFFLRFIIVGLLPIARLRSVAVGVWGMLAASEPTCAAVGDS